MTRASITMPVDLMADIKDLNLNLSRLCQRSVADEVARLKAQRWYEDNKEGIDAYNERIRQLGPALFRQRVW
ncbi:MAG: type II toxin-antitoxin system CcdA family antitoxin [Hyphomonadaceae bacterium]